jgi:hypothetical protein
MLSDGHRNRGRLRRRFETIAHKNRGPDVGAPRQRENAQQGNHDCGPRHQPLLVHGTRLRYRTRTIGKRFNMFAKRWLYSFARKKVFDALQSFLNTAAIPARMFLVEHPDDRSDNDDKAGYCDEPGNHHQNA